MSELNLGATKRLDPVTVGEILREEFMRPQRLSCARLAGQLGVTSRYLESIVDGSRPLSDAMAKRLGKRFDVSSRFWINLREWV